MIESSRTPAGASRPRSEASRPSSEIPTEAGPAQISLGPLKSSQRSAVQPETVNLHGADTKAVPRLTKKRKRKARTLADSKNTNLPTSEPPKKRAEISNPSRDSSPKPPMSDAQQQEEDAKKESKAQLAALEEAMKDLDELDEDDLAKVRAMIEDAIQYLEARLAKANAGKNEHQDKNEVKPIADREQHRN